MEARRPNDARTASRGLSRGLSAPAERDPGPCASELDDRIRLFQGVIEARLLRGVEPELAARIRPAADREWFERLAP